MSVVYPVGLINQRLTDVANAMDAGGANGAMLLLDAGGNTLSTLALARPAASVSGGYLFFNSLPLVDPAAAQSGNAAFARVQDSAGNIVISGLTVTGISTTADIALAPSNVIIAGQTVAITAASIQGH